MRTVPLLTVLSAALLVTGGCDDRTGDDVFHAEVKRAQAPQDEAIAKEIAALANCGKPTDPDASVAYDQAVDSLIKRGVPVETRLIDALRSSADANIRYGCIEVLAAVGTKACVEHLIAVLDDPAALVAWKSVITLRVLTKQRFIPETGKPAVQDLPPVPERDPKDLALDAESRIWAAWHAEHKDALKAAWERWWADSKADFRLE